MVIINNWCVCSFCFAHVAIMWLPYTKRHVIFEWNHYQMECERESTKAITLFIFASVCSMLIILSLITNTELRVQHQTTFPHSHDNLSRDALVWKKTDALGGEQLQFWTTRTKQYWAKEVHFAYFNTDTKVPNESAKTLARLLSEIAELFTERCSKNHEKIDDCDRISRIS